MREGGRGEGGRDEGGMRERGRDEGEDYPLHSPPCCLSIRAAVVWLYLQHPT